MSKNSYYTYGSYTNSEANHISSIITKKNLTDVMLTQLIFYTLRSERSRFPSSGGTPSPGNVLAIESDVHIVCVRSLRIQKKCISRLRSRIYFFFFRFFYSMLRLRVRVTVDEYSTHLVNASTHITCSGPNLNLTDS